MEAVLGLLEKEKPDAVCLQEVCVSDISVIETTLGMQGHFAPMFFEQEFQCSKGVAIFAPSFLSTSAKHYAGKELASKSINPNMNCEREYHHLMYQLVSATIEHQGSVFNINTTHLPVTTDGETTWFQLEAIDKLLEELKNQPEMILCGDTNAPRGREAFAKLANVYKDNIPAEYTTSIDGDLHRAGPIPFMVDGLFTTPGYRAENVRLVSGVSDHYAIVADVFSASS